MAGTVAGIVRRPPWPVVAAVVLGCTGIAVAATPGPAPERGPSDAVLALFAARADASCADYVAATTPFFRGDMYLGSATCDEFAEEAAAHAARGPVLLVVEGVVVVDVDTAEVEVVEHYRAGTDEEYAISMAYRTQLVDGAWAVDHVDLTVLPD